jgi:competence protein ComGC
VKKCRGISFLEIIFAITLLAIISPILFGIFFVNANLSQNLTVQTAIKEIAEDVKSFIKLANYDSLYDLVKNRESIGIAEVEEDGMVRRKFIKCEPIEDGAACKFIAKFEWAYVDNRAMPTDASETCVLPLKCEIYRLKSNEQVHSHKKLAESSGGEYTMFIAKNR